MAPVCFQLGESTEATYWWPVEGVEVGLNKAPATVWNTGIAFPKRFLYLPQILGLFE